MEGKTIIYKSYDLYLDANYAKDILAQNGIEAFLTDDAMIPLWGTISESFGGTKLHIFEKDLQKVEEILTMIND